MNSSPKMILESFSKTLHGLVRNFFNTSFQSTRLKIILHVIDMSSGDDTDKQIDRIP